jgi:hypothetical protein
MVSEISDLIATFSWARRGGTPGAAGQLSGNRMVNVRERPLQVIYDRFARASLLSALIAIGGCGSFVPQQYAPLFTTPLAVHGVPVGEAIVDTGGAYEVILREDFGLELIDTVEVLGFRGPEQVAVTEPFAYSAGGVFAKADFALIGLSACDCNGVGFRFFRKTGTVLGLDFATMTVEHSTDSAPDGVDIEFAAPPPELTDFDSAFMEVDVVYAGQRKRLLGLVDTGTNGTVLRRGTFETAGPAFANTLSIRITRDELGTVALPVTLFDTPGLPDIILGTDVMHAWSDRWYFTFAPEGGMITVVVRASDDRK